MESQSLQIAAFADQETVILIAAEKELSFTGAR